MSIIQVSAPFVRTFILVQSADHISPLTGASPVVQIAKAGGPFAAPIGVVSEIGFGWYAIALSASDVGVIGELSYHVTAIDGDDSDFADQVVAKMPPPVAPYQGVSYNRAFIMVESVDHISPLIGASPIVMLSKAGGAFAQAQGTVGEVGNGWYAIALTGTDTGTLGELSYHCTAAGGDNTDFSDQIIGPGPSPICPSPFDFRPTLAGFIWFIQNIMGIDTAILPTSSPVICWCFTLSGQTVNRGLEIIPIQYQTAVYNLAGSFLLQFSNDQPGAPIIPGSGTPGLAYFAYMRQQYKINTFVSGVVQSSSDEGTSVSLVVQEAAKYFTIADLANLKDPYGRMYLSIAQSAGPTVWGVT